MLRQLSINGIGSKNIERAGNRTQDLRLVRSKSTVHQADVLGFITGPLIIFQL